MMEPFSDHGDDDDNARVLIAAENGVNQYKGNIRENIVENGLHKNVSDVNESHAINLVVDLNHCVTKQSDHNEKRSNDVEFSEKEGEFKVLDLVWGKVKSHPWWPGMIVDPSVSTDKAMRYFKKDGFLIAYFGDQSFAWNESFSIKRFRVNFCEMVNQSDGGDFVSAVNDALREVARRVEFGLACVCLSEEVYLKMKSWSILNDGIRKESSRIDGGDRFSTVDCFKPVKVIDFLLDLATDPFRSNRLEVVTVRGQLSAFNRWKGYRQLQLNEVLDESDYKFHNDNTTIDLKGKVKARGRPPKRKHLLDGALSPSKKVRYLSDLMSNGSEIMSDGEYKPKKRGRKRKVVESNGSIKGSQSQTANDFLSQICQAALNPMEKQRNLDSLIKFSSDFRKYRYRNDDVVVNQKETIETGGFTGIKDSYWTDRIIVTKSDEQVTLDVSPKPNQENSRTALILKFTNLDSVPSVKKLNEIFRRYGTLQESETRVLTKKNCVKVVFEKRSDAEIAFSSSGKFSIFGPALVSYCLDFKPTPRKTATDGGKKGVKSAKAMQFEN